MVSTSKSDRHPDDVAEVLVVCTGNIARSPFAEVMLQREAKHRLGPDAPVKVRSAGVNAVVGGQATEESGLEAERRGLDLSDHRGRLIDPDEISGADLIITMSERQRARVVREVPSAADRTFTLRELHRLIDAMRPLDDRLPARPHIRLVARVAAGARPYVARPKDAEDIRDPHRRGAEVYADVTREIEHHVQAIAPALFGPIPQEEPLWTR